MERAANRQEAVAERERGGAWKMIRFNFAGK